MNKRAGRSSVRYTGRYAAAGNVTRATVPPPVAGASVSAAPCASAITRAIASPSPLPSGRRSRAAAPRS